MSIKNSFSSTSQNIESGKITCKSYISISHRAVFITDTTFSIITLTVHITHKTCAMSCMLSYYSSIENTPFKNNLAVCHAPYHSAMIGPTFAITSDITFACAACQLGRRRSVTDITHNSARILSCCCYHSVNGKIAYLCAINIAKRSGIIFIIIRSLTTQVKC